MLEKAIFFRRGKFFVAGKDGKNLCQCAGLAFGLFPSMYTCQEADPAVFPENVIM
jgi:hypothetical protein